MDYSTITLTVEEGVACLTLERPEVMNALNTQMRAEITHALRNLDAAARVLVLTGAGRAFCSGQDLGDARHPQIAQRQQHRHVFVAQHAFEIGGVGRAGIAQILPLSLIHI